MNPKILGLITARGGSKGIPGKNIKLLAGRPLLAYTVEPAKASGVFDRVILSTDDEEIAKVGRKYGCEVPFMRPKELAKDTTPTLPVLQHALTWLKEREGYEPDYVMLLQPTAPLRQPFHIKEAAELIVATGADSVVSVVEIPGHYNPMWSLAIDKENLATLLVSGDPVRKRISRRQSLPRAYANSGAIYLFKTRLLFDQNEPNFYGEKVAAYPIEERYNANIDSLEDWESVEKKLKSLHHEE